MSILHLFILSSIQGITEFLPISSSGHLILLPALSGQPEQGLMIDIAVHLGTLLSVIIVFRNDLINIILSIPWILSKNKKKNTKLASLLILGSIPLGVAGIILWFTDAIYILRSPIIIASTTLGFGILLYFSDKFFLTVRNLDNMSFFQTEDGKKYEIFGKDGVEKVASNFNKKFLGKIPIDIDLRIAADAGEPLVKKNPNNKTSKIFLEMAKKIKESFL